MILRLLATLVALLLTSTCARQQRTPAHDRIVSLAPAITETLFAIGAGARVVAVSDYCERPPEVKRLPRVGTDLTPNYEAIARLEPSLVVGEANAGARRRELEALAQTRLLPWLRLGEITQSIRELGKLTGREQEANQLASRLFERLSRPEPPHGPRVLLVLGGEGYDANQIWFVRRNSLHGAALAAAGARNSVAEEINGEPRLAQERLFELDPDAIIVLARPEIGGLSQLGGFERYPTLRAVRRGHVSVLRSDAAFSNGPSILTLVDRLREELLRLKVDR